MLRLLFALLLLVGIPHVRAEDVDVVLPHQTFKILQHRADEGVKQIVQFLRGPSRIVTLEYADFLAGLLLDPARRALDFAHPEVRLW